MQALCCACPDHSRPHGPGGLPPPPEQLVCDGPAPAAGRGALEVNGTSYTIPGVLAPGEYVYFVNAIDADGETVATNDTRYFAVR